MTPTKPLVHVFLTLHSQAFTSLSPHCRTLILRHASLGLASIIIFVWVGGVYEQVAVRLVAILLELLRELAEPCPAALESPEQARKFLTGTE